MKPNNIAVNAERPRKKKLLLDNLTQIRGSLVIVGSALSLPVNTVVMIGINLSSRKDFWDFLKSQQDHADAAGE